MRTAANGGKNLQLPYRIEVLYIDSEEQVLLPEIGDPFDILRYFPKVAQPTNIRHQALPKYLGTPRKMAISLPKVASHHG